MNAALAPPPVQSADPEADPEAAGPVPCAHCGLPAPGGGAGPAFCCSGCRGAYALIHEWDLGDYYALRDRLGGRATRPERESTPAVERFAELDEPAVHGANACDLADGLRTVVVAVDGLHCGACAWLIERSVPLVGGWIEARVDLPRRRCEVAFDPARTTLSRIARSLAAFGYVLRPLPESVDTTGGDELTDDPERPARLRRIAVAGFCFANAMWLAVALYAGRDGSLDPAHGRYLAAFGTALAVAAVLGPGRVFLRSAWASVRTRTPHIDLPIAVGLVAGAGAGAVELIGARSDAAAPEVWFDSVCGLVFFLLLGRELQARGQSRAAAAVRALAALRPPLARRVGDDGTVRSVRAADLAVGDVVEVRPGEVAPADGVLIDGETELDRSLLTGEADPVPAAVGDAVAAGVRNLARTVRLRCEATGGATRVAALSRLVGETLSARTPLVRRVDRIGAWFVLAVLLTAALTAAAVWAGTGSPAEAARRAIAVLVVACPCAVSLATPLAIAVAVGRAANRGMLVRRGDLFERLGGGGFNGGTGPAGVVWFDKTGTLTEGRPVLTDWNGDAAALPLAAAVEADSAHPIARALREAAEARGAAVSEAVHVVHGARGVRGSIGGATVRVGSAEFLRGEGVVVPAELANAADKFATAGRSPGFVSIGARAVAAFGVGDRLRPGAANAVAELRSRGWRVGVLSGDDPAAVRAVAAAAGIDPADARGGLSPEEKLAIVRAASSPAGPPTLFVGDGVNDAAALAAADVGIATGGAAEASLQAAGAFCPGGPADVPALVDASRATVRAVRRLLLVSLGYNLLATAGAAAGFVGPLGAAALMPVSSLLVTSLAFAARTFPPDPSSPRTGENR